MADNTIALTPQQAQQLQNAESGLQPLRDLIERARAAGLPVDQHEAKLQQAAAIREGLLQQFPPNLPNVPNP